jgi:2-polyprenyl-6-methoxyphenol hydroxylase-like FAD-dependent oxidoreductase
MSRRVHIPAGQGFALVGDAAGFFDPFTGEGIFRALRGAQLLAANPETYVANRRKAFTAKERLVALIQVFVQTPGLMNFVIHRLQQRPQLARQLASVLGDLQPARVDLVWRLLGP